jgi:hypothetical protein
MTALDDTTHRHRPSLMPKRSWVTLAVIEVLAILHALFGLVAGLPNDRLMEMMGYPDGATVPRDFETALAAIGRLAAMSTLAFALLALAVTLVPTGAASAGPGRLCGSSPASTSWSSSLTWPSSATGSPRTAPLASCSCTTSCRR